LGKSQIKDKRVPGALGLRISDGRIHLSPPANTAIIIL
jgi:hypothetical protein